MCFYEFFKVFGYFLEIKCDDAGIINYYLFMIILLYTQQEMNLDFHSQSQAVNYDFTYNAI